MLMSGIHQIVHDVVRILLLLVFDSGRLVAPVWQSLALVSLLILMSVKLFRGKYR